MSKPKPEPAWLLAKVDQRLALMADVIGGVTGKRPDFTGYNLVMTPLTEPPEDATPATYETWDHSCDNCGKDCSDLPFWTGHTVRYTWDTQVILTFGVCAECKELS